MARHQGRILLIEDDPAVAQVLVDLLLRADYEVDGPYADISDGMVAIASRFPDGAVLDLHRRSDGMGLLKDDLETYDIPFLDCGASEEPARSRGMGRNELENRLLPWLAQVRH